MINPYDFIKVLSDIATPEHVIVPDSSGSASEITQQSWKVKKGQRVICSPGLGSMGFCLPQCIGLSYATDRPIIGICGDGSLQHNIQELAGMRDRNIKLCVWNNGGYNSIKRTQDKFFDGRYNGVGDDLPELQEIADAYDIYYRDLSWAGLEGIKSFIIRETTCIIEVMIDPTIKTGPTFKKALK